MVVVVVIWGIDCGVKGGRIWCWWCGSDGDDARSIRTIGPHEFDPVNEDQIARREQQQDQQEEPRPDEEEEKEQEERRRRVGLGRPRTPEPTGLGMTHLPMEDDEEPRRRSSPRPYTVINQLFERLTILSTRLESAVDLSSTLKTQHTAAQSFISALKSAITELEDLVQA